MPPRQLGLTDYVGKRVGAQAKAVAKKFYATSKANFWGQTKTVQLGLCVGGVMLFCMCCGGAFSRLVEGCKAFSYIVSVVCQALLAVLVGLYFRYHLMLTQRVGGRAASWGLRRCRNQPTLEPAREMDVAGLNPLLDCDPIKPLEIESLEDDHSFA